jgi:hypothetical protein
MSHEEAFIRAFVLPDRQQRWSELLLNERRRSSFTHRLADPIDIDTRWAVPIPPSEQTSDRIAVLLRSRGAPAQCHLISEYPTLDGTDVQLSDALDTIVGSGVGSVVSCLPGALAYYEGELRTRFILQRPPT